MAQVLGKKGDLGCESEKSQAEWKKLDINIIKDWGLNGHVSYRDL